MPLVHPYITFENTKAALDYYQDVFGATRIVRLPVAADQATQFGVPAEKAADMTMHSQFELLGTTIMASDNFTGEEVSYSGITIMLDVNQEDAEEFALANAFWEKVSNSGRVTINMPFEEQFWGGMMGDFTDEFGLRWMLSAQRYSQMSQTMGQDMGLD